MTPSRNQTDAALRQRISRPPRRRTSPAPISNTTRSGSYTLSAIVTKVTGQTVLEYLKPRLFEPLGIDNPRMGTSAEGYSFGGYGLYLRTEDIAKFGQLYLQKGKMERQTD